MSTQRDVTFYWRPHGDGRIRVWRDDWSFDSFVLMSEEEFRAISKIMELLNIMIQQPKVDE